MALPKPGFTQISNEYIDKYMPEVSKEATNVFIAICRKTIGWHKETDRISYSQLLSMTNIKSINGLKKAIKELKEKDVIKIEKTGIGRGIKTFYEINFISQDDMSFDDISQDDTIEPINMSCHDIKKHIIVSSHDTTKENNINKELKKYIREFFQKESPEFFKTKKDFQREGVAIKRLAADISSRFKEESEQKAFFNKAAKAFKDICDNGIGDKKFMKGTAYIPSKMFSQGIWVEVIKAMNGKNNKPDYSSYNKKCKICGNSYSWAAKPGICADCYRKECEEERGNSAR